jgi:hypothetical protein
MRRKEIGTARLFKEPDLLGEKMVTGDETLVKQNTSLYWKSPVSETEESVNIRMKDQTILSLLLKYMELSTHSESVPLKHTVNHASYSNSTSCLICY